MSRQRALAEGDGPPRMRCSIRRRGPVTDEERSLVERMQGTSPQRLLRRIRRLEARVDALEKRLEGGG